MQVTAYFDGGFASVCYLVTDDARTSSVLVDPSVSYASVLARTEVLPPVTALLLTHGHFDHMLALAEWKEKTGAPVCITREDAPALTDGYLNCSRVFFEKGATYPTADRLLDEGDVISVGREALTVWKTPGHTPGSCLFVGDNVMLTGDTIMADSGFGRYDLPGGSARELYASLSRIAHTEGDYILYPGHGRSTTLQEEKNYYIR